MKNSKYYEVAQHFDAKAHSYDDLHLVPDSIMGLHQWLRNHWTNELARGKGRLLEIGCGTGINLTALSDRFECVGIDVSTGMLRECKSKKLTVSLASGEVLPFKRRTFDCVVCVNASQYIEDLFALFAEVDRVLKTKGLFVLDFKNRHCPRAVFHSCVRLLKRKKDADLEKRYSIHAIRKILQGFEWEIERMVGMEFHPFQMNTNPGRSRFIKGIARIENILSASWLSRFAGRIMLSVTKDR